MFEELKELAQPDTTTHNNQNPLMRIRQDDGRKFEGRITDLNEKSVGLKLNKLGNINQGIKLDDIIEVEVLDGQKKGLKLYS